MPSDTHSRLTEAKAALDGVRAFCSCASDAPLTYLTGFQLDMLLRPICQTLEECLCPNDSLPQSRGSRAGVQ